MKARPALSLAAATALFCACGPKAEQPVEKSPFHEFAGYLNREEPCAHNVPGEWAPSYPIPALKDGKLVFKVFFSGWEGNPTDGITYHDAQGDAVITADGKVLSCTRRGNQPAKFPAQAVQGFDQKQWDKMVARMYDLSLRIGQLYAAGTPDRAVIAEYSSLFQTLEDRDFSASYRELNPEFWEWLEANGGKGPQPPAKK